MKLYVAGKWGDREEIDRLMDQLETRGHQITHRWTRFEQHDQGSQTLVDNLPYSVDHLSHAAVFDIRGVQEAEMVLVFMTDPKYAYRGSFTEIGCALGLNKQVFVVCPDENAYCRTNCFFHHPNITCFADVETALAQLG